MFKNMRAELVRRGMTVKDLAPEVQMKYPTLARKCSGAKDFTYSEITRILDYFGMTFEYLFEKD